ARLGQLQDALVRRRIPMCGDATTRESYQGTGVSVVVGSMRSSRRCVNDTRRDRLAAIEDFDVNPLRRHAQSHEHFFHVCHKASRPAEIDIRLSWEADLIEHSSRQMASCVEIFTLPVA